MRTRIALAAPWLAAAAIGGALTLAPLAAADTDPLVPNGGDAFDPSFQTHYSDTEMPFNGAAAAPVQAPTPSSFGEHENNHDEVDDTNGAVDTGF